MNFPTIIFEDDNLLVIDKPSGLIVNSSITAKSTTLQDMLNEKYKLVVNRDNEFSSRSGIVHRLDKDTSGLLLIAKNEATFMDLKQQFMDRKVYKKYVAVVYGGVKDEQAEIDAPILRNPANRTRFIVSDSGRPALTKYTLVQKTDAFSLLDVFPQTGRTHQIRVHFSALGHPVVGDYLYASRHQLHESSDKFSRLMLHAAAISFYYNNTKQLFESILPSDFKL